MQRSHASKLAEILALAPDATWSARFSDDRDHVSVYLKSERLPGAPGVHIDLQAPTTIWRARPDTSHLSQAHAEFWRRLSSQERDPFAGFELTTAELAAVLPAPQLATVLEGLRTVASRHERAAFTDLGTARTLRAAIRQHARGWACPVPSATGQYEDPDHLIRVRRLQQPDDWRPAGSWVLQDLHPYEKPWFHPGWWASRRGADDQARRVLARRAQPPDR